MSFFRVRWQRASIILPAAAVVFAARPALNLPNPIYGSGGSAITATLGAVAMALAGLPEPNTVLFADPEACIGYQAFLDGNITTAFEYWDAQGTQLSCDPEITGGIASPCAVGAVH